MNAAQFISRLGADAKLKQVSPSKWQARCPAHDDQSPSLSIGQATEGKVLVHCHAGCSIEKVCAAVGLTLADLMPPMKPSSAARREIVAAYDYTDETGNLLFQVVRYEPKGFVQRKTDGNGGWIYNVDGVRQVPYRLPLLVESVAADRPVFVCEGEKDCDAMRRAGLIATCNAGGAGKWKPEFAHHLQHALICVIADKDPAGRSHAHQVATNLQTVASHVCVIELPDVGGQPVKDVVDFLNAGGQAGDILHFASDAPAWTPQIVPGLHMEIGGEAPAATLDLRERLKARQFNFERIPRPVAPRYWIGTVPISTPGNLTAISAGVKIGKSSFIGAMEAATMCGGGISCLGVRSTNPVAGAVIHFDTEQSREDHDAIVRQAVRRSGLLKPPPWLLSYSIAGFTVLDAQAAIRLMLADAKIDHGSIHSLLIDGAADLVPDVNAAESCNAFVAELHALAIEYNCVVVCVIHVNPNGEKTRGHLGSQLERKAESNIRLERDGNAIIVWSDKNRKAPIAKDHGPRFIWSDEASMHILTEAAGVARANAQRAALLIEAGAVFAKSGRDDLAWGEFNALLADEVGISQSGARKRFEKMVRAQVVAKDLVGHYRLVC